MTAYSSPNRNILWRFLANLQCISILFSVGHENLLSIWDTHCRFPFQPLEFTALDRTQWYSINWSIVVQFTKYEWTKINLLKRLTRKKDSPYIFLVSFFNLNEKSAYFYLYTFVGYSTRSLYSVHHMCVTSILNFK